MITVLGSWGQTTPDSIRTTNAPTNQPANNVVADTAQGPNAMLTDTNFIDSNLTDSTTIDTMVLDTNMQKGSLETTVNYKATDSMYFDLKTQTAYLYGDAQVVYGDIDLTAESINVDWKVKTAKAVGAYDTTGKLFGTPVFKQAGGEYRAKRMKFNLETKKGIIQEVITKEGPGYIHGKAIKRAQNGNMYIKSARYTTCNLKDPHWHVSADRIKMTENRNIITGPFNVKFDKTPTPLGFLFGFFPSTDSRSSGVIIPTYGDSREMGFFLRNGGYYWAVNDYVGIEFLGEIYTKGSWGLQLRSSYKKRYGYDGRALFRYNKRVIDGEGATGQQSTVTDYWLMWNHNPISLGSSSFSANVNFGSQEFNRRNSFDMNNFVSTSFNSSINYRKNFEGTPFNFSASLRQSQNVQTGEMEIDFPDLNVGMARINPLKKKSAPAKTWWQKLNFSYNGSMRNKFSSATVAAPISLNGYTVVDKTIDYPDSLLDITRSSFDLFANRMKSGVMHQIPISTSFSAFKYIIISPSANYREYWYFNRLNYSLDGNDSVLVTKENGFFRPYEYNTSISAQTRLYGTYYFKSKSIKALRHTVIPNLTANFRPDFSTEQYGFYQDLRNQNDSLLTRYNPYSRGLSGSPSAGRTGSISFSLGNNLEAKVREKSDTSAKYVKRSFLDNLSISGDYNFFATEFKLSNISLNARTQLFKMLDVALQGTIDPYYYKVTEGEPGSQDFKQERVDSYAWNNGQGLGHLSRLTLSVGTSFNPEAREKKGQSPKSDAEMTQREREIMAMVRANPDLYVDFDIPWDLNVNFYATYNKVGLEKSNVTRNASFSGNLSLTPKWKIGLSSGWDFEAQDFSPTRVSIYRDLHCWEMSISWIPFGIRESYSFDLNVKAPILQDAKLSRRATWYDRNRF